MPSIFSRSKQPTSKPIPIISSPVLCEHPTLADFGSEAPLMQIPKTPPPPPPPFPASTPRVLHRRSTTPTQIIDLYKKDTTSSPVSRYRGRISSPDSEHSSSEYEYNDSIPPSPSPTFLRGGGEKTVAERNVVGMQTITPNEVAQAGPFPNGTAHAPVPFVLPSKSSAAWSQAQMQKELPPPPASMTIPPIPRTDALGRGLSKRFATVAQMACSASSTSKTGGSQSLGTRTRQNTRMQGHWLRLGTMRIDPKELRKQEKEAELAKKRNEEELRRIERKMAKEARKQAKKAGKVTVLEI